jgi:hypothetical protein
MHQQLIASLELAQTMKPTQKFWEMDRFIKERDYTEAQVLKAQLMHLQRNPDKRLFKLDIPFMTIY